MNTVSLPSVGDGSHSSGLQQQQLLTLGKEDGSSTGGNTAAGTTHTLPQNTSQSRLTQAISQTNTKIDEATMKVEFEFDPKSKLYWINVLNKNTGKVIFKIPPETVRKIVDGLAASGPAVDMKG